MGEIMGYVSVSTMSKKWGISERTIRNYCALGKISGAFLTGKTWNIPEHVERPDRINKRLPTTLLEILQTEMDGRLSGGIYHKVQIDIIETSNHFRCIDIAISNANHILSEKFIKQIHAVLKSGTGDARNSWFTVGDYKKIPNEVGGMTTTSPEDVPERIKTLLSCYNASKKKDLQDIIDFHVQFERIHPFQDGNGRVGRLILFKECLRNDIVPFILGEDLKMFYYRGLQEWDEMKGYLMDTCLTAQDRFKEYLDYFKIPYKNK